MNQPELTPDLIFEPDGHVSDVCLTCVADGELALVPQAALDHLDACDACGARLGEAALLAVEAREALVAFGAAAPVEAVAPAPIAERAPTTPVPPSPRRARRPLPIAAIAAALFLAAVTAGPTLSDLITSIPSLLAAAIGWLPTLMRVARAVLWNGSSVLGPWALAIKGASAVVFVLAGLQVARMTARRAMAVEGGER